VSLDAGLSIVASRVALNLPPVVAVVAVMAGVAVLAEELVLVMVVAMRFAHKMQCTKLLSTAVLDESSSSATAAQQMDGVDDDSSSDAAHVTVTALFKKKTASLSVGEHISLESLLIRLSQTFGCRVKVKLEDDDGDQIAITSDQELADALAGEDEVTLQCFKDLKWRQAVVGSSKKGSANAASTIKTTAPDVVAEFADRYSMFDELLDPYVVINAEGTVLAFNPSAEKLLGYAKKKVLGKNVKMLMPDTYAKKHDSYLAKYARTGVKNVIDAKRTVMAKASSGAMIAVELGVTEKELGDDVSHFVGCLRMAGAAPYSPVGAAGAPQYTPDDGCAIA
jgi:PAS domain S-box-containing protein